ncbi:flippase [Coleofasciculus sp. F4-SAH-05]|uniref:flippase n=1 Tax=Coleofasciculus sp. F4-SAH-05 TaxID=3069525 RepID=UPI003300C5E9
MASEFSLFVYSKFKACRSLYRRGIRSDFIRKVAETFATRVALIGIGLMTSVIVARTLGPEGRGIYAVATAIGAIGIQVGNLGLHASNTYYVARDRKLLPQLVSNTLALSFGFGCIIAALVGFVFIIKPNLAPIQGLILVLALLGIPFGLAYMLLKNILLGIYKIEDYNKIELANKLIALSIISFLLLIKVVAIETIFFVSLMATIISLFGVTWKLKQYIHKLPLPSLKLFKKTINYGIKAYMAAFFTFLVLRSDLFMVQYMLGSLQSGYYSIAVMIADMIYMLPVVIGSILFPKLSAMPNNQNKWRLTKKLSLAVCLLIVFISIWAILFVEPTVRFLFGVEFLPTIPAFYWLIPAMLFLSINRVYMNYFAAQGMPLITVYSPGIALVINIVLNFKTIPLWGIVGASISSIFSYGLMLGISMVYLKTHSRRKQGYLNVK